MFVFVHLLFGILVRHAGDLPSYLHLWHNELFDRAMIFCCYLFRFICWGPVHLWVFNCGELS